MDVSSPLLLSLSLCLKNSQSHFAFFAFLFFLGSALLFLGLGPSFFLFFGFLFFLSFVILSQNLSTIFVGFSYGFTIICGHRLGSDVPPGFLDTLVPWAMTQFHLRACLGLVRQGNRELRIGSAKFWLSSASFSNFRIFSPKKKKERDTNFSPRGYILGKRFRSHALRNRLPASTGSSIQ